MKLSVILAVSNGEKFIKSAIESILEQTFTDFEFIIVDDASTDATPAILEDLEDKRLQIVINKKKKGLTASLNLGLKLAQGEYIARMDADDIALPNRFDQQIEVLEKQQDLALVGTGAELIDEEGKTIGRKHFPASFAVIKRVIMRFNPFIHPSVMIRRKVIEQIGGYDESLDGAEDYDLFLRIVKDYKAINLPEVLLKYRIQKKSVSWQEMKKVEKAALKARWKALTIYGYPWWQAIYLVKPGLAYAVPAAIKRKLLTNF